MAADSLRLVLIMLPSGIKPYALASDEQVPDAERAYRVDGMWRLAEVVEVHTVRAGTETTPVVAGNVPPRGPAAAATPKPDNDGPYVDTYGNITMQFITSAPTQSTSGSTQYVPAYYTARRREDPSTSAAEATLHTYHGTPCTTTPCQVVLDSDSLGPM